MVPVATGHQMFPDDGSTLLWVIEGRVRNWHKKTMTKAFLYMSTWRKKINKTGKRHKYCKLLLDKTGQNYLWTNCKAWECPFCCETAEDWLVKQKSGSKIPKKPPQDESEVHFWVLCNLLPAHMNMYKVNRESVKEEAKAAMQNLHWLCNSAIIKVLPSQDFASLRKI